MKKKLLIIPLLLLTSCNDPMFFEGKKATPEEMQSVIDKMDNNGAFIKHGWYEYNAEEIRTNYFKNNNYTYISKFVYNFKFLAGSTSDNGYLRFEKLIGTRKMFKGSKNNPDEFMTTYEYFANETDIIMFTKDETTNDATTTKTKRYSFFFNTFFLNFYSDNYKEFYVKENAVHIKINNKIDNIYSSKNIAFSYDDKYNLNKGKYKVDFKYLFNDDWCTLKSVETIEPCEEQTFEVRKDYEEEAIWKYLII